MLFVTVTVAACQGMDRLEPDRAIDRESGDGLSERGTLLDATSSPEFGEGGRLTQEIATRWLRQLQGAGAEERLQLAAQFLSEYPEGEFFSPVHELVGDAHSELGRPREAADAWERAILMGWPAPDILQLPLTDLELPFQVGWARFEAGDAQSGADWLTRATFVSDRPQLEQGLRFLYAELGTAEGSFDEWFGSRRAELAVQAPDFELPGHGFESLKLSEVTSRLTLLNFWTPT
jgi:hypothetical protein